MSSNGTVNDQVTDAVTQSCVGVVGISSSQGMAMLDAVMAETLGMAMHNAVGSQRGMQMLSAAAVTATCARILGVVQIPPPKVVPPAPLPPAPVPPAPPPDTSGEIAQDAQQVKAALGKLIQDAEKAATSVSDAEKALDDAEAQAKAGLASIESAVTPPPPPTPPAPPASPAPPAPVNGGNSTSGTSGTGTGGTTPSTGS